MNLLLKIRLKIIIVNIFMIKKTIWVFGGSKSIGNFTAKNLTKEFNVVCFSRTDTSNNLNNYRSVIIDFSNLDNFKKKILEELNIRIPDGVVFSQRYRPVSKNILEIDNIIKGIYTETLPLVIFFEAIKNFPLKKNISCVLLTSVAGTKIHIDLPIYYHLLKSNLIVIANYYSIIFRSKNIKINVISLGEFHKYKIEDYNLIEKQKYQSLKKYTFSKKIIEMQQIYDLIYFLLIENSKAITGQNIFLDGNLCNIAQESIIRSK